MAVLKGSTPTTGRSTGRPKPKPKDVNAVTRALRSKKTSPAAAARSMKVAKGPGADEALAAAQVRISSAKSKIRKVARRSVRKGMGKATSEGLSITRDEGSRGLQRAVKTVGYKKARKIVNKTKGLAGKPRRGPARKRGY